MSFKKKIVIVISIISILMLCFSISSFAVVYPSSIELKDGDIITFKNPITIYNDRINIQFHESGNNTRLYIAIENIYFKYLNSDMEIAKQFAYSNGTLYNFNGSIVIYGDQTITNGNAINWLYENTESGLPPLPTVIEPSFWETVSGFFSEALASGTAIVNWMTITPIALIPLALYCIIVIIAITKRMIKG